jgi:hypothetical protein
MSRAALVHIAGPDELRIVGTLADDASLTYAPTTTREVTAVLSFLVRPAKGLPYMVRQVLGTDPKAHFAAAGKVTQMRRGRTVEVYAKGLRAQTDHGDACLVALDVTSIALRDTTTTHAEPQQKGADDAIAAI